MCLNLKNKAATQFQDYPFSSFCNFRGMQLASGVNGLYKLGGSSDVDEPINWLVETPVNNWGISSIKRPRYCEASFICTGEAILSLLNQDQELLAEVALPSQTESLPQAARVTIPRTVAQKFWKFKLSGDAKTSIDSLVAYFVVRSHGLSKNT